MTRNAGRKMSGKIILFLLLLLFSAYAGATARYGPFDYSNPEHREKYLEIVEKHHFNEDVRFLRRGQTGSIWGDLGYVLRAFPNHHQALDALMRLHFRKDKPMRGAPSESEVEKRFTDAIDFAPHDPIVNIIYGIYLYKSGRFPEAEEQYLIAIKKAPESSEAYYNLGLLYFEEKKYDKALELSKKAYELGYPLPGLRDKLKKVGVSSGISSQH